MGGSTRRCPRCLEEKPYPDGYYYPRVKRGVMAYCKPCWNKYLYERRKARGNELHEVLSRRLADARTRAQKRAKSGRADGVCEIDRADLERLWKKQGGRCALTGREMATGPGPQSVSVDRIDSSRGYIPENIQLVCHAVNVMKRRLSNAEFVGWCYDILAHNGGASDDMNA